MCASKASRTSMDPSLSTSRPPAERGSRELLEDWARRFGPALRRYFARHAPPAEAEDLVQELFLGLARRSGLEARRPRSEPSAAPRGKRRCCVTRMRRGYCVTRMRSAMPDFCVLGAASE